MYIIELLYESADASDIDVIFQLNCALIEQYEDRAKIDYHYVLSWTRRKIETYISAYTRVRAKDMIVGYYYFHSSAGKMEIDDLFVLPEYRCRGIGTKILCTCISKTDLPVFLYVFAANVRAISLYKRMGFEKIKSVTDTRYIMERKP